VFFDAFVRRSSQIIEYLSANCGYNQKNNNIFPSICDINSCYSACTRTKERGNDQRIGHTQNSAFFDKCGRFDDKIFFGCGTFWSYYKPKYFSKHWNKNKSVGISTIGSEFSH